MEERENEKKTEYISLQDATKLCDYSQEYLSLRARSGKMKAVKLGRNWFTAKEWLDEYVVRVDEYKETIHLKHLSDTVLPVSAPADKLKEKIIPEPPADLPVQSQKIFRLPSFNIPTLSPKFIFGASLGLVFILLGGSLVFGKETFFTVHRQLSDLSGPAKNMLARAGNNSFLAKEMYFPPVEAAQFPQAVFGLINSAFSNANQGLASIIDETAIGFSELPESISQNLSYVSGLGDSLFLAFSDSAVPGITEVGSTISLLVYETSRVGDLVIVSWQGFVDEAVNGSAEAFVLTGEDINESLVTVQEMGEGSMLFASKQASLVLASLQSASLEALQAADRAVDRGLLAWGQRFSYFAKTNIAKAKSGYEFLVSPWREINYPQTAVIKKQIPAITPPAGGKETKSPAASGGATARVETTRETIRDIRTIDDAALADLRSQIALLRTDIANKLSAPGGVVTQRVYITESVSTPRVYQQNQDVIVQSIGSGNVMLTAATGMHIAGSQVVIDSTDVSNPLIYLADETKVNGPLTSQTLLVNSPAGFAGNVLTIQKEGGSLFSVNTSGNASLVGDFTVAGNLSVGGTQSNTSALSLTASSTVAALTVVQQGSGSIVDVSNSTNATADALTVANLGSGNSLIVNDQSSDTSPFVIDAAGNVAIGTTTASYALQVWGSAAFGTSTTPALFVDSGTGRVGIGTSNPSSFLDISSATTIASGDAKAQNIYLTANPAATSSANYYASMSIADYQANYPTNSGYFVMGDWGEGRNSGTATLENVVGGWFRAANTSSGTINDAYGVVGQARNSGSGTMVRGYGSVGAARNNSTGVITDAVGLYGDIINANAAGIITNAYNIKAATPYSNVGAIQNLYGVYIDSQSPTGGGTINNKWAFYQAGPSDKSYFAGNVGIGTTTPSSLLDLYSMATSTLTITSASSTAQDAVLSFRTGATPSENWKIYVDDSDSDKLVIATSTSSNLLTITQGGFVGIGTTSPISLLAVSGNSYFSGNSTTTGSSYVGGNFNIAGSTYFTGLTAGSVPFIGANGLLSQNNNNLYWDNTNYRLGIGTSSPASQLSIYSQATSTLTIASASSTAQDAVLSFRTGATPSENWKIYVDDSDSDKLVIATSTSSNLLTITQGGFVGIGTTSPVSLFSVTGDSYFSGNSTTTGSSYVGGNFNIAGSTYFTGLTAGSVPFIGANGLLSQNNNNLYWDNTNYRLGIGTSSPASQLSIYSQATSTLTITSASSTAQDAVLSFRTGATPSENWKIYVDDSDSDKLVIATSTSSNLLTITQGGFVGIGTTSPISLLAVSGNSYFSGNSTTTGSSYVGGNFNIAGSTYFTGLTAGSVPFIGANGLLSQNNNNLYWDNTNYRLGIGTSSPASQLSIYSQATSTLTITSASSTAQDAVLSFRTGATPSENWKIYVDDSDSDKLVIATSTSSNLLTITQGGFVGINSSSPTRRFSILDTSNPQLRLTYASDSIYTDLQTTASGYLYSYATGGRFGLGTSTPGAALDIYSTTTNQLRLSTSTSYASFYVDSAGSLNIETQNSTTSAFQINNATLVANQPMQFNSPGDLGLAYDLSLENPSAAYIRFSGAGWIQTESPYLGNDLNLSAANSGKVAVSEDASTSASVYGLYINNAATNPYTNSINKYGLYINTATGDFTGSTGDSTVNYGLYVDQPSGADTNYGAVFAGGFVGIGTSTPVSNLEVQSLATSTLTITSASSTAQDAVLSFRTGATPSENWKIYVDDSDSDKLVIATSTSSNLLTITQGGFVGIGTTSPISLLAVSGNSYFSGNSTTTGSSYVGGNFNIAGSTYFTGLTAGSVPFIGANGLLSQNNNNLYWDNTNYRLGIGTSSPASQLSIYSQATSTLTITSASSTAQDAVLSFRTGATPSENWKIYVDDSDSDKLVIATSTSSNLLTITQGGNIGIGTTSPQAKLDVWGNFQVGTSSTPALYVNSGTGNVGIGTAAPEVKLAIYDLATTTIKLVNTATPGSGSVDVGGILFQGKNTTGADFNSAKIYVNTPNASSRISNIHLQTGYADVLTTIMTLTAISGGGYVGIGTTSPQALLDVYGASNKLRLSYNMANYADLSVASDGQLTISPSNTATTTLSSTGFVLGTNRLVVDRNTGWVGIGTTTPASQLSIYSQATSTLTITSASSTAQDAVLSFRTGATPSENWKIYVDDSDSDKLKIATSSDSTYQALTLGTDGYFLAQIPDNNATAMEIKEQTNSYLTFDTTDGAEKIVAGKDFEVGLMNVDADSGAVNFVNMNISTTTATSTVESLAVSIDGTSILTVYGEASGYLYPGMLGNMRVGIGTTTPWAMFSIHEDASSTNPLMVVSTSSTDAFFIDRQGNVGIGTTAPYGKLQIGEPTAVSTAGKSLSLNVFGAYNSTRPSATFFTTDANTTDYGGSIGFAGENGTAITPYLFGVIKGAKESGGTYNGYLSFFTTETSSVLTERMRIDSNGNVGIGTSTPAWKLHVFGGGICVDASGNGVCPTESAGAIAVDTGPGTSSATSSISFDIAERYPANEILAMGEVAVADKDNPGYVRKSSSSYQSTLLGVVSGKPAIGMEGATLLLAPQEEATSTNPYIALAGRVNVKVSLENGPIVIGDALTSASSTPGIAMKATKAGRILGYALEPFTASTSPSSATGTVMLFVNPGWQGNDLSIEESNGQLAQLDQTQLKSGLASLGLAISEQGGLAVSSIKAQDLEIGSQEKPTGITIYDEETGQPFCIKMKAGAIVTIAGKCPLTDPPAGGQVPGQVNSQSPTSTPETILDKYPATQTTSTSATFVFYSTSQGASFQCQVNNHGWEPCVSPKHMVNLTPGDYKFEVFSVNSIGVSDTTPSVFYWTILESTPIPLIPPISPEPEPPISPIVPDISTSSDATSTPEL